MRLIELIDQVTTKRFNKFVCLLWEEALIYRIKNLLNLKNLFKRFMFKMVNRNKMLPFPAIQI